MLNLRHAAAGVGGAVLMAGAAVAGHGQAPAQVLTPTPVAGQTCFYNGWLPDASCTPGATDSSVTQENIATTICVSGYSAQVRPPVSVTDRMKRTSMTEYGVGDQSSTGYEYDHLISLELGGAPSDARNLWPEPYVGDYGARVKDRVENAAHREVCAGQIPLAMAQQAIASDWIGFGQQLGVVP